MSRTADAAEVLSRYTVDEDGCWIWTGKIATNGYGRAPGGRRGHWIQAHRVVYEATSGPIPNGLELDHLCKVPACVNPAHLQPVTHAENVKRGNGGRHNKIKTHCPSGHPYDDANTKWYQGRRYCRTCHLIDSRRYKAAKRARARIAGLAP